MFSKILLAYDGSETAQKAADYAAAIAARFDATILLLYAYHPAPRQWSEALRARAREEEAGEANMLLGKCADRLRKQGVRVDCDIVEGLPHEAILRTARVRESDLIVIGSAGLGAATPLLGSVSDRVVHRAHCPVLVVR
jgi:nucleotide-binding universal stress UspA family protein